MDIFQRQITIPYTLRSICLRRMSYDKNVIAIDMEFTKVVILFSSCHFLSLTTLSDIRDMSTVSTRPNQRSGYVIGELKLS